MPEGDGVTETVRLRDNTLAHIRPIRPDDAPRLQELFGRLSPETVFFRFGGPLDTLTDANAAQLANLDARSQGALVATAGEDPEAAIIAVARYARTSGDDGMTAEVAVVVEDTYQGRGLGTILLDRLAGYARGGGIRAFTAWVQGQNQAMIRFLQQSGLPVTLSDKQPGAPELRVDINLAT